MSKWSKIPTPCYLIDVPKLTQNLQTLKEVKERAGCKILLAQKAFSMYAMYPLIGRYLDGTAASGLFEARLGHEEMGGETHVFAAAYRPGEMNEILNVCDHVVFNSLSEWERYRDAARRAGKSYGIRVNPEHSTQDHAIYDPCAPGSRLGVTAQNFPSELPDGITGMHFHTLCEQDSDALVATLRAVEQKFGAFFPQLSWINMGGGHHITRADYDIEALVDCVRTFRAKYGLDVYLEPGEAIALNAGVLVSTVLDVVHNERPIAILDASAACHMPDVLEMPYRPEVERAGKPEEKAVTVRLAGPTCLAGDVIGDYSFDAPLRPGDRVVFRDMAIYTMVKNNTFNGMGLPSIAVLDENGEVEMVKTFGYRDFKGRLS